jgi:uncharacterized repeat protein (TIGR03803 family)
MNSDQHRGSFSRRRLQAAVSVLAFAVLGSQLAQAQTFNVLHNFKGPGGTGVSPYAGLVRDAAGNLYGTTYQGGGFLRGTVFKLDTAGKLTVLHNFAGAPNDGANPAAGLVRDAAGNLYGTTYYGGTCGGDNGCGTVFKLDTSGKETVLHSFGVSAGDGSNPEAGLILDGAGNLYGTTVDGGYGGCNNGLFIGCGTVFKVDRTGKETVLYLFAGSSDGEYPYGGLVRDNAGNLYGTTNSGGGSGCDCGTVFKVDTSGKETVLHTFTGSPDGALPFAGLLRDPAGNLYGTTSRGGASEFGTVFKVDTNDKESVLYSFGGSPDGAFPSSGLVQDNAGSLYGTTDQGGASGAGAVFKLDTAGTETVLHSFAGSPDGSDPYAGLVLDAAGHLYGTTVQGGSSIYGAVFKLDTTGKETVLYSFVAGSDGLESYAGLVRDAAGNLYGTTSSGGNPNVNYGYGNGMVFKIDKTGKEKVLYKFGGSPDGADPRAGVVRDNAGNLYGTTSGGGENQLCEYGCGTVFKISASGQETVLHDFCSVSGCTDGAYPYAGLLRDGAGNLYGTTSSGGLYGAGTVFELDTSGSETVLYNFTGYSDGAVPIGGLVRDNAGNLYGTAGGGGAGHGTVFKVNTTGKETVLYSFTDSDGPPSGGLLRDKNGTLYGTTVGYINDGTVFKLDTSGKETVLHYFDFSDGQSPQGPLIQDKAGSLYGTTVFGGKGSGTVFKLDTAGALTVLRYFDGGTKDGASPQAGVIRDAAGNLYGTTENGGIFNWGMVFKLTP